MFIKKEACSRVIVNNLEETELDPFRSTSFPTNRVGSESRGRMICGGRIDLNLFDIEK